MSEQCLNWQDECEKSRTRAERAEAALKEAVEALKPFAFHQSEWGSKVYKINETVSTDWIVAARAVLEKIKGEK